KIAGASAPDAGPLQAALACEAARTLGQTDIDAWSPRLDDALLAATRTLEAGATSSPGMTQLARALLLRALGREEDAARALAAVFTFPDRNLSYYLARRAMKR